MEEEKALDCQIIQCYLAGGNSWNGMYDAKFIDGELKLYATMSLINEQKK